MENESFEITSAAAKAPEAAKNPEAGILLEHFWIQRSLADLEAAALMVAQAEDFSVAAVASAAERTKTLMESHESSESAAMLPLLHLFTREEKEAISKQHKEGDEAFGALMGTIESAMSETSVDRDEIAKRALGAVEALRAHFTYEEGAMRRAFD